MMKNLNVAKWNDIYPLLKGCVRITFDNIFPLIGEQQESRLDMNFAIFTGSDFLHSWWKGYNYRSSVIPNEYPY